MRVVPLLIVVLGVAVAGSAGAQPIFARAKDDFQAALAQQCPEKNLQMLSPSNLRDGLDSYIGGLGPDLSNRMQQAERADCSSLSDGVDCVDMADIATADRTGHMADLVQSICGSFLLCRDEGDCDYAR